MNYIERNEECERVYEISFDRSQLESLKHTIIRFGSYETDEAVPLPVPPLGAPFDEDIYDSTLSFDSKKGEDEASTKKVEPVLASIVGRLLDGYPNSIYDLICYRDSEELVSIDERIRRANNDVNSIENSDYVRKVKALDKLRDLFNQREKHEYFDADFLMKMYNDVLSAISYQLISETTYKKGEKKLLLNYIPSLSE